jgi:hypothetical protein
MAAAVSYRVIAPPSLGAPVVQTSINSAAPLPQVILPPDWKSCPMPPPPAIDAVRNAAEAGDAFAQVTLSSDFI